MNLDTPIKTLAAAVGPAVLGLRAGSRGGSGVIVAPGIAVTLYRNLRREQLTVRAGDTDLDAHVVGTDASVDLAVLRLAREDLPVARWGNGESLAIGDAVYAFADPHGRGLRVTAGAVSSAPTALRGPGGRLIEGAIEHTAPLPRGSGGGPLVDADGRILGLNALRRGEGLIVAWPAAVLAQRADALASGRVTAPPKLGVALAGPRQARRLRAAVGLDPVDGLLVQAVQDRSPAQKAGIARGDVLVGAGGTALAHPDDLYAALDGPGGSELTLDLLRGERRLTVTANVAAEQ